MPRQIIRQVVGHDSTRVIGCLDCGEVETLYGNAEHHCGTQSSPFASTLSTAQLGKMALLDE